MAQINFETAQQVEASRPAGNGGGGFDFFTLKNDSDQAIVRFCYKDVSEFDIFTVHTVNVGGKYRKVNCIRDPRDVTEACPLCASGNSIANRFFIKMIEYRVDNNGTMTPTPVLWERSLSYATKLKSMLDEYGPLQDCLFKVKRNGAAGSMDTTYDIMFCSPKVYPDEAYPIIPEPFKDLKLSGTLILDKTFQELETFVSTGSFPTTSNNTAQPNIDVAPPAPVGFAPATPVPPTYAPAPAAPVTQQPYNPPAAQAPATPQYAPTPNIGPGQQAPGVQRPVRYY